MIEEYLKFAIEGILHRRLRSWLTMVGIFIGIFAVVALISLGQGLQAYIDEQFEKVGGDRILISPGGGFTIPIAAGLSSSKLTEDDLKVVKEVHGVYNAVGTLGGTVEGIFKEKQASLSVISVPVDSESIKFLEEINYFKIEKGRFLREDDHYNVVIGAETHTKFNEKLSVGSKLTINGKIFEVVGITKKEGNPFHDRRIIIPLKTGREIFGKEENNDEISLIIAKVSKGYIPKDVAEDIKKKLRKHRSVKEGEEDFSVETSEKVVESFKNVVSIVQYLLVGIAAISLIVGGVGIMNTMYTSVLERTKQIGIMKSVGARNSDILSIFLMEAGLLGLVGGIIGVILGMITSYGIEFILKASNIEFISIYISPELIVGTLIFSFSIGCISGILPARKASLMNPVDALRYHR